MSSSGLRGEADRQDSRSRVAVTFCCGNHPVTAAKIVLVLSAIAGLFSVFTQHLAFSLLSLLLLILDLVCLFVPSYELFTFKQYVSISSVVITIIGTIFVVVYFLTVGSGDMQSYGVSVNIISAENILTFCLTVLIVVSWNIYAAWIFKEAARCLLDESLEKAEIVQASIPGSSKVV